MSVKKKALCNKRVSWGYEFAIGPRDDRQRYKQGGYSTRQDAINAESARRLQIEHQKKVATGTLDFAIQKFFEDRDDELSPKTTERYRELVGYLRPELRESPIADISAMRLHDEWKRLLAAGGHHRKTKPRDPCPQRPCAILRVLSPARAVGPYCTV